jgi:hypothetical protein
MKRSGLRRKAAMAVSQTHLWLPAGTVADDRQVARRHICETVLRDDGQGVGESERTGGVRDRDGFVAGTRGQSGLVGRISRSALVILRQRQAATPLIVIVEFT